MAKKEQKQKSIEENRWVVSTEQMRKRAQQKGLYKAIISLAAKKDFNLCPTHISDLVYLVGDAIRKQMLAWHEAGGEEGYDKEQHFRNLESLLYLLEDLFPYHFEGRSEYTTYGDEKLFRRLSLVRKDVAFPPQVEKFYIDYEVRDAEFYRRSPTCIVCGEKQANGYYENIIAHEDCLAKQGWYRCEWCGWVYPNNKKGCERKLKCKERQLTRIKNE